jgi:hypothetical protein
VLFNWDFPVEHEINNNNNNNNKMTLNDSVLPENLLNEEEQALNSLIPEKSKGRRFLSEITSKQWQDLNKVATVNESDVGVFS